MQLINGPSQFQGKTRPVDFVRHGSTKLNDAKGGDKIRGWVDIPLDERGIEEAKRVAKELASLKDRPTIIYTSDLQRASHTAHIINSITGIQVAPPQYGLRPWNLGHFQGQESAKIAPQMRMFVDNPRQRVPGGESFNEFENRFLITLAEILRRTPGRTAIISHHRNERLLAARQKAHWQGFDKTEFMKRGDPPGSLITFEIPIAA